jgi:hypothetical protein
MHTSAKRRSISFRAGQGMARKGPFLLQRSDFKALILAAGIAAVFGRAGGRGRRVSQFLYPQGGHFPFNGLETIVKPKPSV